MTTRFQELLAASPVILGEGAVIENLRRMADIQLDEQVVNSVLIYQEKGRAAQAAIYRQYLEIGQRYQRLLLLSTPTWRALAYLINCTHVSIFRSAMRHESNSSPLVRERLINLLANTAALSPEELDARHPLVEESPETFGNSVSAVHREFGMKVLGGCCGTDQRHIECLAMGRSDNRQQALTRPGVNLF